jgi:rhodanese-related sulfurtransferase
MNNNIIINYMNSNFFLYTGIITGIYTLFASFRYYSLTGSNLISCSKAKKFIKNKKIKYIIDVRTLLEWNWGHYINSLHIPIQNINKSILDRKISNKNDGILVYCNTGQRARNAAEKIISYGYNNVYYIDNVYTCLY